MITEKFCPICLRDKLRKKITCRDHSATKEVFTIVSCETCSFVLTNPRPDNKNLPKYYNSKNYISHTNNTEGLFNWLYQKARKYAIKKKVLLLNKDIEIKNHLDYGCGTGEFLSECRKEGFKTKGVEPSEKARLKAIKNHNLYVSANTDLKEFQDSEFTSISLWHVLEHV